MRAAKLRVHRMSGRVDLHGGGDECIVADLHVAYIEDDAIEVEIDTFAEIDITAVIAIERRL